MLVFFFISAYNMSRKGVLDMAHTVNVNFKLDEDVKKRMERINVCYVLLCISVYMII